MADAKVQLKEIYPIPEAAKKKAWVSGRAAYDKLWKRSVEEPEKFWAEIAEQQVTWFKKWDKVMDYNFDIKKVPSTLNSLKAENSTSLTTVWTDTLKNAAIRLLFNGKATSPVKQEQ
jgi:hypothetical protein